ncbi:NAD(P)/FAD-dependent oxidoreductase [Candidatus Gracilibacteria bacterium]|nr:NAD(P)/FAD-dependent oxidoreductase [Candidatus Gracilibacteria bacterium]
MYKRRLRTDTRAGQAARLMRDAEQFADYGLVGDLPTVDFPRLLERTRAIVEQLHNKKKLSDSLRGAGVTLFDEAGAAKFIDAHHIALGDGTRLQGESFIICAGGHARRLNFPGSELTLTASDVWTMRAQPASVAIVGAAATGCQLASVFDTFGSKVTLLELAPRILSVNDEMISKNISAAFIRRDIDVVVGISGVKQVERHGDGLRLTYTRSEEDQVLDVAAVIISAGWPGNAEALNLTAANVESERGFIKVDSTLRSSQPHIFAAGDITGRMMLVQGATDEGRAAAQNAVLGRRRLHEHRVVPNGGFTDPEYGSVGLTEAQAREQHEVAVATVDYAVLDRAVIDGRTEGSCKLIVSRETHGLLGAHVVGEQAVEIVHIVAALMQAHSTIERLAQLEIAYPTFAAVLGIAARQISRDLGTTLLAPDWGGGELIRPAEWEKAHGVRSQESGHHRKGAACCAPTAPIAANGDRPATRCAPPRDIRLQKPCF